MTREIPLTQGKVALVDDDMYDYLMQWKWCLGKGYAIRFSGRKNGKKNLPMHHHVIEVPVGMECDHRDGNRLNNQRANLRVATHAQNQCNIAPYRKDKTSQYKGVRRNRNRWQALIKVNQVTFLLGRFDDQEEAAKAYDQAAKLHFGEFAYLNFPEE